MVKNDNNTLKTVPTYAYRLITRNVHYMQFFSIQIKKTCF